MNYFTAYFIVLADTTIKGKLKILARPHKTSGFALPCEISREKLGHLERIGAWTCLVTMADEIISVVGEMTQLLQCTNEICVTNQLVRTEK